MYHGILVLFLALNTAFAADGAKLTPRQQKAEVLAKQAQDDMQKGDYKKAFAEVSKALKKDGNNVRAHYVRGMVAALVALQSDSEKDQHTLRVVAQADFTYVSQADPTGLLGGLARGQLTGRTDTRPALPVPEVVCSVEATQAFDAAEAAFQRHDMATARTAYLLAVERCPTNPTWQVYLGDAYFVDNDRAEAIRRYEHALVIDPCNWQAHRFLADQYIGAGKEADAYAHLVDALSCNPNYFEARGALGSVVSGGSVPLHWPDSPSQAGQVDRGEPWTLLAAERTKALAGGATPLDAERAALKVTLVAWRANPTANEAFRLLSDAETAGKLDEAIFALLLDRPLFADFLTWRETHREELKAYIRASLATYP